MKPKYYDENGNPTANACAMVSATGNVHGRAGELAELEHERDEARRVVRVLAYVLSESTLVPGLNDAILTVESWGDE